MTAALGALLGAAIGVAMVWLLVAVEIRRFFKREAESLDEEEE